MTWAIVGTWAMCREGIEQGAAHLRSAKDTNSESQKRPFSVAGDALVKAIGVVEADPNLTSVGLGALPNREGKVFLDAGYMEGKDLSFGAVADLEGFLHPIQLAQQISPQQANNFLVGKGAAEKAHQLGLEQADLVTERSYRRYLDKKEAIARCEDGICSEEDMRLSSYIGHDTVGMIALDEDGHIVAGTSTSGLYFKAPGRVGDSPCVGLGYYADDEIGGAVATGVGEEISKGVLPYRIVMLMEMGLEPQQAAEKAVLEFHEKLLEKRGRADDISVLCMNKEGVVGAATNTDNFSFVLAASEDVSFSTTEGEKVDASAMPAANVYRCTLEVGHIDIREPELEWTMEYEKNRLQGRV